MLTDFTKYACNLTAVLVNHLDRFYPTRSGRSKSNHWFFIDNSWYWQNHLPARFSILSHSIQWYLLFKNLMNCPKHDLKKDKEESPYKPDLGFLISTPTLKSLPYPLPYLVTYIRSDRVLGSSPISLLSASKGENSAKVRSQLFL